MKTLICILLFVPFLVSSMELVDLEKKNDSRVKECYLAACPKDICNIIAQMIEREPKAFKRFVPESDEELINKAKLRFSNSGYRDTFHKKNTVKDYPDYKNGKLTIKAHIVDFPSYLFGFKVFTVIAQNKITKKHLLCAHGKHYLYTNKMLIASPNNTKILWVEEEETYHKNALLYTDSINIYDLVTDTKKFFEKKYKYPMIGMAIANDGDTIARAELIVCRADRRIVSVTIEKLTTGKTVTQDYEVPTIDEITFNAQGTKLIMSRKMYLDKHDFALIDLLSLQECQPQQVNSQNKLLALFRAMGVCKKLQPAG